MAINNKIRSSLERYRTNRRKQGGVRIADLTLKGNDSGATYITEGAAGAVTFTLPSGVSAGVNFTFIVGAAQELRVQPAVGETLCYDISGTPALRTVSKYATANAIGERVTFESSGTGLWYATAQGGTWTEQP